MIDESGVNSQITDSVTQVVTLLTGQAPSQAFGMLDAVLLETLGMAMHNAVTRQQHAHMTSTAAVTAACAKMLQAPVPVPPPPAPSPPPGISELSSPPPTMSGGATVAAANAEATEAITVLQAAALGTSSVAKTAQSDLQAIAVAAQPAPPTEASVDTADADATEAIKALQTAATSSDATLAAKARADLQALVTAATPPV